MEAADSFLTKEDFIQRFKYEHTLLRGDPQNLETYEAYALAIRKLRSDNIKYLKRNGVPGEVRMIYNDAIQALCKYGHREYLFYKDPTCKICGYPIEKLEQATIDHIHPIAKGGENALYNKQIAHGRCNVLKSDKIGFTLL